MHFSHEQLPQVAEHIVLYLQKNRQTHGATVLALEGNLGAGKTSLVQHIASTLGVEQSPVSPTFVIMRSYATGTAPFSKLVHIDAYRIEDKSELPPLRLDEVFKEEGTLVCIEWPENLGDALPQHALRIALSTIDETIRDLTGPEELLGSLQNSL